MKSYATSVLELSNLLSIKQRTTECHNNKIYNKLVRDNIINVIEKSWQKAHSRILNNEEFYTELKRKLQEEVNEFLESDDIEELAEIFEVVDSF